MLFRWSNTFLKNKRIFKSPITFILSVLVIYPNDDGVLTCDGVMKSSKSVIFKILLNPDILNNTLIILIVFYRNVDVLQ